MMAMMKRLLELLEGILERLEHIERLEGMRAKNVLDTSETAELLGVKENTVRRLTCDRDIPHSKRGTKNWYDRREVERWQLKHRVKTNEELSEEAATRCALKRDGRTRA